MERNIYVDDYGSRRFVRVIIYEGRFETKRSKRKQTKIDRLLYFVVTTYRVCELFCNITYITSFYKFFRGPFVFTEFPDVYFRVEELT